MDCPFHRYENGRDLSEIHLHEIVNLPAVVIHAVGHQAIGPDLFQGIDVHGKAVIIHTGWSVHWNTETYYSGHPFLTEQAALLLKSKGAVLVGIDSHNIDDTSTNRRPVHSILLGADIFIVEHMANLDQLPADHFLFTSVPPKVLGMGTFPVRAFASII
jgi:kynurenine formamidase